MTVDNSALIAPFAPATEDGDTFIYTELLDRTRTKGNNGVRLARAFFHRSQAEFWEQWPALRGLCDATGCRAYTRLAPRSFNKVGKDFARLVVDSAMSENWAGMKSLYQRACGTVAPIRKLWLLDVDDVNDVAKELRKTLALRGFLVESIPSRKGLHYITHPFRIGPESVEMPPGIEVHKDNPTNLYIPDGAA